MTKAFPILFFLTAAASSCVTLKESARSPATIAPEMDYVEVCDRRKQCKNFSRLIMGTGHLAQGDWSKDGQPEMTEAQIHALLNEAVRLGINLFDSSPNSPGSIEGKLGKWLKEANQHMNDDRFYADKRLNPDRELYALSKGGFPFDLYAAKKLPHGTHSERLKAVLRKEGILGQNPTVLEDGSVQLNEVPAGTYASRLAGSEEQIVQRVATELGQSLENLNGDIAIYLMHRDDGDFVRFNEITRRKTSVQTILNALSTTDIASKVWVMGWSNWTADRVNASVSLAAKRRGLIQPVLNSPYFSLFEMSSRSIHAGGVQVTHKDMMDPRFQPGIKLMPYSPLGGFSILDRPEPQWENARKAAKEKADKGDPYWQNAYAAIFTDENQQRFLRVVAFTKSYNKAYDTTYTVDQMINAYALAHNRTDFLVVGPLTVQQLRRTVDSLKLSKSLTPKDLEYLYSGK